MARKPEKQRQKQAARVIRAMQGNPRPPGVLRYTVILSRDEPGELARWEGWLLRWRDALRTQPMSKNRGCGCCVDIYDLGAPPEAAAELPDLIAARRQEEARG